MTLTAILALATRAAILRALRAAHGSRAGAARALGISLSTLQRHLAALVTPEELAARAQRHGWPTRPELAAHARSAR